MSFLTKKVLEMTPDQQEYLKKLENLTDEEYKSETSFIGSEPLRIKTISAQDIYNYIQMFPSYLV